MFKHTLHSILAAGLLVGAVSTGFVADTAVAKQEEAAKLTEVQTIIRDLKYLTDAKVNHKAEYFILLNSASWCPPCQREMPHVVAAYKDMLKSGKVELILLSADRNEKAAVGFLTQHKGNFPVVMGVPPIPGYVKSNGVPNATIIDKNGKVIKNGHGSIVKDWKTHTGVK